MRIHQNNQRRLQEDSLYEFTNGSDLTAGLVLPSDDLRTCLGASDGRSGDTKLVPLLYIPAEPAQPKFD